MNNFLKDIVDLEKPELQDLENNLEGENQKIKNSIIEKYEMVKPVLMEIRNLKKNLMTNNEKLNMIKTFVSIEENSMCLSNTDIEEISIISDSVLTTKENKNSETVLNKKKFTSPLVENWLNKKTCNTK